MKLLPPPGPERRRLVVLVGALVVLAAAYYQWGGTPAPVAPTLTGPPAAPVRAAGPARPGATARAGTGKPAPSMPQPLKLADMEQVPDEPVAGRNLFRYGVKPPPPPPPYVPPPPPPPAPPPVPQGPPPIPLKLTTVIPDPYAPGRNRAYLADTKAGVVFEAVEGDIVDGRYKLLKVGQFSVVMSYLDGSGQRTINLGGV